MRKCVPGRQEEGGQRNGHGRQMTERGQRLREENSIVGLEKHEWFHMAKELKAEKASVAGEEKREQAKTQ